MKMVEQNKMAAKHSPTTIMAPKVYCSIEVWILSRQEKILHEHNCIIQIVCVGHPHKQVDFPCGQG